MTDRDDASGRTPPTGGVTDEPWGAQADLAADTCREVERAASRAFRESLLLGGDRARLDVVGLVLDASDTCGLTARLLGRRSELATRAAVLCAEVCQRCAEICAVFQDDPALQACAGACRHSAEACRSLARDAALIDYDEIVEESFPASDAPPGPGTRSRK